MTSSEIWDEETAQRYDRDAADKFAAGKIGPTVSFLERMAESGEVLELAVGTGRVAIPLIDRGLSVTGVELSPAMVGQLRRKIGEDALPVAVGDMATTQVDGMFSLVYLVWNGLSNLLTQEEQVACFHNAARHLDPGGRFVVELWVPPLRRLPPGQSAVPFAVTDGYIGFDEYDVVTQSCVSHHYWKEGDGRVRYDSGRFRYAWPAELDLMATMAGLEQEDRFADWAGSPFTAESENCISVWRKPGI